MLNVEKFTFEDYKSIPVEVTVWNRIVDTPTPVLCIDYDNVADTHQVVTLRERSGFRHEPYAIVSLLYSYGTDFYDLKEYAQRTGQLTVGIVLNAHKQYRKEQKQVVGGIKRRIVEKLGWTTARCALDDKQTLWMPSTDVEILKLDEPNDTRINIFKIQWSGLSGALGEIKIDDSKTMYSMTLIVRKDLDMMRGKVRAQCAHAALGACHQQFDSKKVKNFLNASNNQQTVTLEVNSLAELEEINEKSLAAGLNTYVQLDAGYTQVPANTPTVLAIGPDDPERIHVITENLKLF